MTKIAELRELGADDLARREREIDEEVFRLRLQRSTGQAEAPHKMRESAQGTRSSQDLAARAGAGRVGGKRWVKRREVVGVVVRDKMERGVVVAVERRVSHDVYGKIQRRTSKFMAHDEADTAKVGDRIAMVESRPLSRRKRYVVTRVIERAGTV